MKHKLGKRRKTLFKPAVPPLPKNLESAPDVKGKHKRISLAQGTHKNSAKGVSHADEWATQTETLRANTMRNPEYCDEPGRVSDYNNLHGDARCTDFIQKKV